MCHACKVAAKQSAASLRRVPFDAQAFLDSAGVLRTIVRYVPGDVIFRQGDACTHVMYIQSGNVKLSVLSKAGREAVVAMLGPGDFFGEGCLAGQRDRHRGKRDPAGAQRADGPSAPQAARHVGSLHLTHAGT